MLSCLSALRRFIYNPDGRICVKRFFLQCEGAAFQIFFNILEQCIDAETSTENAEPLSEEDAERELEEALKKAKLDRWRVPLPFILVFIIWTYAAIWQWTAFKVKDEIQDSFREYAQSGVYMQGQLMTILGFPNTYIIRYKGKITSEKADLEIPMISVNSNLRTGSPITLE